MFDIKQLAEVSGIRSRLLRYVLDQQVVANLELTRDSKRNTRVMNHFAAFSVLVAATLLHSSLSREMVAWVLGQLDGAATYRGKLSLYRLYSSKERYLRLGDAETVMINGKWLQLADGVQRRLPPMTEVKVSLHRIRRLLSRKVRDVDNAQ